MIEAMVAESPTSRIVIAGDSAGANLALELALTARDAQRGWPAALLLFYGVYTRGCDDESMRAFGDGRFGYSLAAHRRYLDACAVPDDARHAFPLDGPVDLRGLPPTLVMAAGLDVLRDPSRALVKRLRVDEVRHSHVEVSGVTHGFLVSANALPEAVDAIDIAGRFALLNA